MPNTPSKPSNGNHEAPKGSSLRDKILLVLSGFALGALVAGTVIKKCSNNDSPKKPDITDVSKNEDGGSDNKKVFQQPTRPAYPSYKHELVCEPPSDEEIEARAHEIETKRLTAIAQDIFKQFCITNPDDREAILGYVLKGYTKFDGESLWGDDSDGWRINLKKVLEDEDATGSDEATIELKSKPACRPPLNEKQKKNQEKSQKHEEEVEAMKKQIESKHTKGILGIDIRDIEEEIKRVGIKRELGEDLISMLRSVESEMAGEIGHAERQKILCELETFGMMSELDIDDSTDPGKGNSYKDFEKNPTIKYVMERLGILADALNFSKKEKGNKDCFRRIYTRR